MKNLVIEVTIQLDQLAPENGVQEMRYVTSAEGYVNIFLSIILKDTYIKMLFSEKVMKLNFLYGRRFL